MTTRLVACFARAAACASVLLTLVSPTGVVTAGQDSGFAAPPRLSVQVTSAPTAREVTGLVVATDDQGQAVLDFDPNVLEATLDGAPVEVSFAAGRPSIALLAAFLLDATASLQTRELVASGVASALRGVDVARDRVAVVSTAELYSWQSAVFTTSPDELARALGLVVQNPPRSEAGSAEQLAGALRALDAQPAEVRVLLLVTNRPPSATAPTAAALESLRGQAAALGIRLAILALPGAGSRGPLEALAEATPGGRVELVQGEASREAVARQIGVLLAPFLGARKFAFPAPAEGSHTLSFAAPGAPFRSVTTFTVVARPVAVAGLEMAPGVPLPPGAEVRRGVQVSVRLAEDVPLEAVEWTLDGMVVRVSSPPYALQLDPDRLGEGRHELSARAIAQGRLGPAYTTSFSVPFDLWRAVRSLASSWGLIGGLVLANVLVAALLFRLAPRQRPRPSSDSTPMLRLKPVDGLYVAPQVIEVPASGKLRIGYHPPFMDNHVGDPEFARLPHQDIRGDEEAIRDLSRHVACIWRDPETNDCYVQLGWPGPGEPIRPRPQTQVLHLGRPQEATSVPLRLVHHDVLRLASNIEYVFYQLGIEDKPTPVVRKVAAPPPGDGGSPIVLAAPRPTPANGHASVEES